MHKQKVKLARSLRSKEELKSKTPIFQTANWEARKVAIANRVAKKQGEAHQRAVERKEKEFVK